MCRIQKPGTNEYAEITCLELIIRKMVGRASALMRSASGAARQEASNVYSTISSILSGSDVDLSRGEECHTEDFSRTTSCLDMLFNLDETGNAMRHVAVADKSDLSRAVCTISRIDDQYNIATLPGGVAEQRMTDVRTREIPVVSCLDKVITKAIREKNEGDRSHTFRMMASELTSSKKTRWDTPCRNLAFRNGEMVNEPIPCEQKYFGVMFPVARDHSGEIETVLRTRNLANSCVSYEEKDGNVTQTQVPCMLYLIDRFGSQGVFGRAGGGGDTRCAIIANNHFFEIMEAMKPYEKKYGEFKRSLCSIPFCPGYDDATGQA